ncbi:MAG: right-handed parallel beta-helix repeat-containing protein [Holophagales bacterium]|jgi:predicted Ser/Thr protein kinase|nr:right-handed parallel beta-helix repeat-containing protein [Holophagales bacterium]
MTSHIGKFEIIRSIGKGAMGEVFLGKDPLLGREVAIKTIQTDGGFDDEAKARFQFEARATAALNHPNIVTVFDFGHQDDKAYLVMEYVDGNTLEALIANGTSKQTLLEVLAQVCDGLAYAHEEGLVHRDIKPGNILVSVRGKRYHAKLVDFGVAQPERGSQTEDGEWMGSVHYMAPEYLKSGSATASADLFAVGVILYEILSGGRKPFDGEDATGVLSAIISQPIPPLTTINLGGLPPTLLAVVAKALDKDPLNRYPDAESLGQAILNALSATPANTTAAVRPELMNVVVGRGGQATCLSLRVALRQAASGAQIRVLPGVYKESIVIDKDVVIVGENGDPSKVIIETTGPPAVRVKSGRPILKDLTLRSTQEQIDALVDVVEGHATLKTCLLAALGNCAINVEFGAEVAMQDCIITGHGRELLSVRGKADLHGGYYSGATKAAVSILKNGQGTLQHVNLGPGDGVGLMLEGQAKASLDDTVIKEFDEGCLELNSTSEIYARNSQFLSSKFAGLIQSGQSKAIMENCQFTQHEGSGVHATGEAEAELKECKLNENIGYGISLLGGGMIMLDSCEISRNREIGVLVHQNGIIRLLQCKIREGQAEGVHCFSNAEANLELCDIRENTRDGIQIESASYVTMKQCVIHDNQGAGMLLEENTDVFLESCVIQKNAAGSISLPAGGKHPTLLGNSHIEAYEQSNSIKSIS